MKNSILFLMLSLLFFVGCKETKKEVIQENELLTEIVNPAPEWSKNANIYEINIRQYTKEGSINAITENHLTRLKELGVDIIWLMPIHPISKKNRKGSLGSYYAAKDFKDVNPDFGTKEDFRKFVETAHGLKMKVILDWVPNHTGFDNNWTTEHPEWYTKNEEGEITHPIGTDWTDVADLNYDNPAMRAAMTDAMLYWIQEFDIDGYRCDVAGEVPNDFWIENNQKLKEAKSDIFMLAEWDEPSLHDAGFHMTYGWGFHHVLNQIAQGKTTLVQVDSFIDANFERYGKAAYKMNFITNHDENSWNGTIEERMGPAANALAVMAFTIDGMPLIYSGQEAGLNKRLKFFEKDQIDWSNLEKSDFYRVLLQTKTNNPALWNGLYGGEYSKISTTNDENIFCYQRKKDNNIVIVALNLSGEKQLFKTKDLLVKAKYFDLFEKMDIDPSDWAISDVEMDAWGYKLLQLK